MMADAGMLDDETDLPGLRAATGVYLTRTLASGEFHSWVAEVEERPVACAAVVILLKPPGTANHSGREAYVMNVYTLPRHRGQGLATALAERVLDWCRGQGLSKVSLHATEAGGRIYRRLGFEPRSTEMVLRLTPTPEGSASV